MVPWSQLDDRRRSCFNSNFLVLVLSETVLVLVLEGTQMTEPIFDHERLDVYRLAIEYVASSYRIAKSLGGPERHARDQWLRAAQSIPLNIAEGNGKQSLNDKSRFFEIARGSALECAAIHDILISFEAIDTELNRVSKTNLKRIVSMLARLIQRTDSVSEGSIEYEYRDAEYEYEKKHEQSIGPNCSIECS
jgi:four helix bundle protein